MPEHDADQENDPAAAADRLERALDRIAAAAQTTASVKATDPHAADLSGARDIAARLDMLITRLKAALAEDGASHGAP